MSVHFTVSADCDLSALGVTIADIRRWHAEVDQHNREHAIKILVGNKLDLGEDRVVTEEQGRALANDLGMRFFEVSVKDDEGVTEALVTLARSVIHPLMAHAARS